MSIGKRLELWVRADWHERAACREEGAGKYFFPHNSETGFHGLQKIAEDVAIAKTYCRRCPVQAECLEYAEAAQEQYGVWGGMTKRERDRHMGRGRGRTIV